MTAKKQIVESQVNGRSIQLHPCKEHSELMETLRRIEETVERIVELLEK